MGRSVLISDTELPSDLIMWWVRRTLGVGVGEGLGSGDHVVGGWV